MLIYGMDDSAAFEVLKWRSQETNTKLRLLARQLAADFVALSHSETLPARSAYDTLLLTTHLRIDADTESGHDAVLQPSPLKTHCTTLVSRGFAEPLRRQASAVRPDGRIKRVQSG